jgi:GT2 family glycosyltransferase
MIQEFSTVDKKQEDNIIQLLNKFNAFKLIKTNKNEGTGRPRHNLIAETLNTFNTPYIMTFDDDMEIPLGGIESLLTVLESDLTLGSCSLACEPRRNIYKFEQTKESNKHLLAKRSLSPIDYGDAIGSATQVIRREVYNKCTIDPNYYIGCWDFDFCMQMRNQNWKIAILNIEGLCAINNNLNSSKIYMDTRTNLNIIKTSRQRLMNKWNIYLSLK